MNGDVSKATPVQFLEAQAKAEKEEQEKKKKKNKKKDANKKVRVIKDFCVNSTQAFDDLIDNGYCIEGKGGGDRPKLSGNVPKKGDPIRLSYVCYVWDSQQQIAAEISSSDDEGYMEFVLDGEGDQADPSIIKAMHLAVKQMSKGMQIRLISGPSLAYGVAGSPPSIPPLAHLVYELKLEDFGQIKEKRKSIIFKSKSKAPDVQPRNRITSARMQPVTDRMVKDGLKNGGDVNNNSNTPAHLKKKEPKRLAGHIMLENNATDATNTEKPSNTEIPKYDYQTLKKMVADKVDFGALNINRAELENHLKDEYFEEAFQMTKTNFLLKPHWRQQAAKRAAGLA